MVDITGLQQNQGAYRIPSVADKGGVSQGFKTSSSGKTLLPSDQVVQNSSQANNSQNTTAADQSQRIDIFVVRDNVFSLYKLPNGELFSKVRNLKTGEERVYPYQDSLSYFEAIRGNRGMFVEKRV